MNYFEKQLSLNNKSMYELRFGDYPILRRISVEEFESKNGKGDDNADSNETSRRDDQRR